MIYYFVPCNQDICMYNNSHNLLPRQHKEVPLSYLLYLDVAWLTVYIIVYIVYLARSHLT